MGNHVAHGGRRLVADIGGTSARFAILDQDSDRLHDEAVLACADYSGPAEVITAYLAQIDGPRPVRAGLAVAAAVTDDHFRLTNHGWDFRIRELRENFHLNQLLVINDFTALAYALPHLPADEIEQIGAGYALDGEPVAVLGPGTGLGVSGLLFTRGGAPVALAGEGGHVAFAPGNERENNVLAWLRGSFEHVSVERVLSGPGLSNIHRALCALHGWPPVQLTPAEIVRAGLANEQPVCCEALTMFCAILGGLARDLALTIGARGGVYLGGGIVPRLSGLLARSGFRRRFEQGGRLSGYLSAIPTYVVHSRYPALVGMARAMNASAD